MAALMQGRSLSEIPIGSAMSRAIDGCSPSDDVEKAAELMRVRQVRRVPGLDAEGRVLGVLSLTPTVARTLFDIPQPTAGSSDRVERGDAENARIDGIRVGGRRIVDDRRRLTWLMRKRRVAAGGLFRRRILVRNLTRARIARTRIGGRAGRRTARLPWAWIRRLARIRQLGLRSGRFARLRWPSWERLGGTQGGSFDGGHTVSNLGTVKDRRHGQKGPARRRQFAYQFTIAQFREAATCSAARPPWASCWRGGPTRRVPKPDRDCDDRNNARARSEGESRGRWAFSACEAARSRAARRLT